MSAHSCGRIYTIIGKKLSGKYHPLTVLNYVFILGTIGFLPFYFLTPHADVTTIPLPVVGAILFLAVFCSIIAYLIYNVALDSMDVSRVACSSTCAPVDYHPGLAGPR